MKRIAVLLLSATVAAVAIRAAVQTGTPTAPLAAFLPQGALLTIESPDFASLLHDWTASPEAAAWVKSDSYSVFSRSGLFGRLADAQAEFQTTAGLPPNLNFLQEVAGRQSIFAWYDIGNLEFLYLTRMPAGKAEQTRLLQSRTSFSRREIGDAAFYTRTGGDPQRTVAFATSGDWLLLATREDLLAGALQLIASSTKESVATEPWYSEAQAADHAGGTPSLHMTPDLARIVRTPQFRTYWFQRNITDLSRYRSATSDLFREPEQMREERTLIPKTPAEAVPPANVAVLAALVPPGTGVFRAIANPTPQQTAATIEEKLLGHTAISDTRETTAPNPDLSPTPTGSASDLETRIDASVPTLAASAPDPLLPLLQGTQADSLLTLDTAIPSKDLWIPLRSAIVLHTSSPLDAPALQQALAQTLAAKLTTGKLGLTWKPVSANGYAWTALSGPHPLFLATRADLIILASDATLLTTLLDVPSAADPSLKSASYIAGFDHDSQRAPFMRLTKLVDRTSAQLAEGVAPAFFSRTIGSLSNAFAGFRNETIVERPEGPNTHQTVTWTYRH